MIERAPRWATVVDERIAKGYAPGMVALAAYPDRIEYHAAGFQDLAKRLPVSRNTLFRIASVTKMVTAVAALMLVDDAILSLDDPVDRWLPELVNARVVRDIYGPLTDTVPVQRPITSRDLLSMTFGLGVYFAQRGSSPVMDEMRGQSIGVSDAAIDSQQYMARIQRVPLAFHPGAAWLYHTGIEVAGILIERVSGERLGSFMKRRIFDPLGMRDTGFSIDAEQHSRLSRLYAGIGPAGIVEIHDAVDRTKPPPMDRGGGALISSADDLAALGMLLLAGGTHKGVRLLSQASITEMSRDQVSASAKERSPMFRGFWECHGFGLGMCVATAPNHVSAHPGRFGWWGGTGTALFIDPSVQVVMASLTQRMIVSLDDSANADAFMHAVLSG